MRFLLHAVILFVAPLVTVQPASAGELRCLATTGMVGDLVKAVVGDRGKVEVLMPSGVDPHLYQPTRSDLMKVLASDVIFYNGLHLEGRMDEAFVRAQESGRSVCAVAEELPEQSLLRDAEDLEAHDPHVWMDPKHWRAVLVAIRDRCVLLDPDGREAYESNTKAYAKQLEALDGYASQVLQSVPEKMRVLVTAHDAFGYFGKRFGFEVIGLQGISTESEASVQDVNRLVDVLVQRKIPAIFVESTVPEKGIRALIEGADARGHPVAIGGSLYSDAMGTAGTWSGTYLGMIDHNVTAIARALGGQAPEAGWRSTNSSVSSESNP
ncbi:MAG: zinc ABC transporter substrate-binding protein [Planctomycetota bacterium]|nr:zinc ABC transporter substrate-binding protein [Planctomycetota bacterium]